MTTTENIGLTQFVASDKPTWLGNWNTNMQIIDDFAGEVKEAETQTESTIDDIQATIASMQAEVTSAQQEIDLHSTRLTNLESDVTGISTDMTKAQNDIISLFNKEGATGGILSAVQYQLSAVNTRSLLNTENITNLQSSQSTQDGILETLDNRVTALEGGGSGGGTGMKSVFARCLITSQSSNSERMYDISDVFNTLYENAEKLASALNRDFNSNPVASALASLIRLNVTLHTTDTKLVAPYYSADSEPFTGATTNVGERSCSVIAQTFVTTAQNIKNNVGTSTSYATEVYIPVYTWNGSAMVATNYLMHCNFNIRNQGNGIFGATLIVTQRQAIPTGMVFELEMDVLPWNESLEVPPYVGG